MNDPDRLLSQLVTAHREVRRPDPALRAHVARTVEREQRRSAVRRWVGGSLTAIGLAAAALLLVHWVAGGSAQRTEASPAHDAAVYGQRPGQPATAQSKQRRAQPAHPKAPRPPESPPANVGSPAPTPTTTRPQRRASSPPRTTSVPPPAVEATDDGTREVALLRQAEVTLRSDAMKALTTLHDHAREFPDSAMSMEREALFVLALCAAGRADGSTRRTAFLQRFPRSAYAARVRAACVP